MWVLHRVNSGDGSDLASILCKYDLKKGDLFVLSWARVRQVRRGSLSSDVYLDHLKFCVVCINSRRYVCCSECNLSLMSVMSLPPALCNLSVRTAVKLCILSVLALGVSLVS